MVELRESLLVNFTSQSLYISPIETYSAKSSDNRLYDRFYGHELSQPGQKKAVTPSMILSTQNVGLLSLSS